MLIIPNDWEQPFWRNQSSAPHDWHNYVSAEVKNLWSTFSVTQKQALASCFDEIASREEWD